jgi:hypothetical protein
LVWPQNWHWIFRLLARPYNFSCCTLLNDSGP